MILEWLIPATFGILFLIFEQLSQQARQVRYLSSANRPAVPKTVEEALAIGARDRKELISEIGRRLPLEVSLDIFKLSGFAVASDWTAFLPEYQKDLQQAAFKYLQTVSKCRARNLTTIAKALSLAEKYVESLEEPVDQAEACATLFLAAGSKFLGPRLLSFTENLQIDPQKVFRSLVSRTGMPESFLHFGGDVLIDIRAAIQSLIKIGLERLAYPLIALSETQFGYALYSALFNEVVYYTVAAAGRPDFCPQGRIRATVCQKFLNSAKGCVFERFLEKKVTEIGDALLFVWNGEDKPEIWTKISSIVNEACGQGLPPPSVPDMITRITSFEPDYIYTLLSLSWKCDQRFNPNTSISPYPSVNEALARLSTDRARLLVDHQFSCAGFSPAYKQVLLEILKNSITPGIVRPISALMFSPGLDSETLVFLIHALKSSTEDCGKEAETIIESLYATRLIVFERLTVDQFNLIARIAKVSPSLSLAISRRILYELDGDLLDTESARLAFNGALKLSKHAFQITLQAIESSPRLTCSPHIWQLIDRLPAIAEAIEPLYHS